MENLEYIPINKNLIPYSFNIKINEKTFTFSVHYNAEHDFFTINLFKEDKLIVSGEKIVYGRVLFDTSRYRDIPDIAILPYDLSQNADRVTWNNFNDTVFLWLLSDVGDENE